MLSVAVARASSRHRVRLCVSRTVLLAVLLLSLAPVQARADGAAGRQYAQLIARLKQYRDGLQRSARRLSLEAALAIGVRENPSLRKAYAAIQDGDWTLVAIQREWWPSLKVGNDDPGVFGWMTSRTNQRVRSSTGWTENLTLKSGQASVPNLNLNWTFFDPTRDSRDQVRRSEIAARRFLFLVDARDLILQIQKGYYALQEQYQLEQVLRDTDQQISRLADSGLRPGQDPGQRDQLYTQRLGLLIRRINTHARVILAANALAQDLSLPPGELALPADDLERRGRWDQPLKGSIDQALQLREEIQVSLARAGGESWSARARMRAYLPKLSLAGQLSSSSQTNTSGSLIGAFQSTTNVNQAIETQLGLGFEWTIFDGGILAADAAALRSRSRQSLAQADLDRLSVTRQVQDNHAELINSLIVLQAGSDQMAVARQSFAAAGRAYLAGRGDATRVVQASNAYLEACVSYLGSLRQHNSSIAALYRYSAQWPEGMQLILSSAYPGLATAPRRPPAP